MISWRKFDEAGLFWLFGKDWKIEVRNKEDNEVIWLASLEHGAYQVFPIVQHGKIYITATDFWHQALGHSSTRHWSNAKEIYADSDILPRRPSHFWYPQCALYNSKEQVPKSILDSTDNSNNEGKFLKTINNLTTTHSQKTRTASLNSPRVGRLKDTNLNRKF